VGRSFDPNRKGVGKMDSSRRKLWITLAVVAVIAVAVLMVVYAGGGSAGTGGY
jgi:hypothetical protein